MTPVQTSSMVLGPAAGMGHKVPLAYIHCRVLELSPGMLGPGELVRRLGIGGHSDV